MSYNQRFNRTIEVYYSGSKTVSYPASEHGGSMTVSYSGTTYENVTVDINVNTTPFDASVSNCNRNVNLLTASVATMDAAQCASIAKNSEKVSKTIIDGFFHTVRTDLSTQKMELEQTIEARLLLLRQQANTLFEKRKTMEADYARTSARYQKIFDDLNKELSVRIHALDQPVFDAVGGVDTQSGRMLHTEMVSAVATTSKESALLQAQLSVANVKHHALQAMNQIQQFIMSKLRSEQTLHETTIEGSGEDSYMIPVCYMNAINERNREESDCVIPEQYNEQLEPMKEALKNVMEETDLGQMSEAERQQLGVYLQNEIAQRVEGNDSHSARVRALINKMFND